MKTRTVYLAIFLLTITLFKPVSSHAEENKKLAPAGFLEVSTAQLDKAWKHPKFNHNDYTRIALELKEFDFRATENKRSNFRGSANYELTNKEKEKLENKTYEIFIEQIKDLDNFEFVPLSEADEKTIIIKMTLVDFVNKVPNLRQQPIGSQIYTRTFGAATLDLEMFAGENHILQFKGYVREDIESMGFELERATKPAARIQTQRQLERWAKGLKDYLETISRS